MKKFILLLLLLFNCALAAGCNSVSLGPLSIEDQKTNEFRQDIETYLDTILTASFTAEAGAYTTPESGGPPQGFYPYTPVDLVRFSYGSTATELFIKLTFTGTSPHYQETAFNNKIRSTSVSMALDLDRNPNTGCLSNYGAEALLVSDARFGIPAFPSALLFSRPTGIEEPESSRYGNKKTGRIILGGVDYNFVVLKFPFSEINASKGQLIDITVWAEAESDQWHHFSFKRLAKHTITL